MAGKQDSPDREDVRALVAPLMDGRIEAGAFFAVAHGPRRRGLLSWMFDGVRRFARERRSGLAAFNYFAVNGPDLGVFELRWSPFHVRRVIGRWPIAEIDATRTGRFEMELTFGTRRVEVEAAAPGPDADAVIERLTAY